LDFEINNRQLFVRPASTELWKKLVDGGNLLLTGPPGTGKSSLVWAWCCWYACQGQNNIRWIHLRKSGKVSIVDFSGGSFKAETSGLRDLQKKFMDTTASVLVLDGITQAHNLYGDASVWLEQETSQRLIVVSSLQFTLPKEDLKEDKMEEISLSGWTKEEYMEACKDATFFNSVKSNLDADTTATEIEEQIGAKFFIAGASARWMFCLNSKEAIEDARTFLRKLPNASVLMKGLSGDRGQEARSCESLGFHCEWAACLGQ